MDRDMPLVCSSQSETEESGGCCSPLSSIQVVDAADDSESADNTGDGVPVSPGKGIVCLHDAYGPYPWWAMMDLNRDRSGRFATRGRPAS